MARSTSKFYPLRYAADYLPRIKASVRRRMTDEPGLLHRTTRWGRGPWPFFSPAVVPHEGGTRHDLGEDWAFSDRLRRIGVTPLADTSTRPWHFGRYGFAWEGAGIEPRRCARFTHRVAAPSDPA